MSSGASLVTLVYIYVHKVFHPSIGLLAEMVKMVHENALWRTNFLRFVVKKTYRSKMNQVNMNLVISVCLNHWEVFGFGKVILPVNDGIWVLSQIGMVIELGQSGMVVVNIFPILQ